MSSGETLNLIARHDGQNITTDVLTFLQKESEVTHWLLTLSPTDSIVIQTVIWANILSGTLYRLLLFHQVWKDDRLDKPINIMTGTFL